MSVSFGLQKQLHRSVACLAQWGSRGPTYRYQGELLYTNDPSRLQPFE